MQEGEREQARKRACKDEREKEREAIRKIPVRKVGESAAREGNRQGVACVNNAYIREDEGHRAVGN